MQIEINRGEVAVVEVLRKDGPKEAIQFVWETKSQAGKKALRSHYAVFSAAQR